jgi:broad specificity phosphatase PhoE
VEGQLLSILYLARHGETDANIPGHERLRGLGNWNLTETGRKQAKDQALRLAQLGVHRVIVDDLLRTRMTADYAAQACNCEPVIDPGLRPWDLGDFEGELESEAKPQLMHYIREPHRAPPGGKPYHSFFHDWQTAFWHYFRDVYATGVPTVMIGHSGHFATLDDVVLNRGSTPTADYDPNPGEIFGIRTDPVPTVFRV